MEKRHKCRGEVASLVQFFVVQTFKALYNKDLGSSSPISTRSSLANNALTRGILPEHASVSPKLADKDADGKCKTKQGAIRMHSVYIRSRSFLRSTNLNTDFAANRKPLSPGFRDLTACQYAEHKNNRTFSVTSYRPAHERAKTPIL